MTKISNKTAYGNENPISDNDFILGTNGDTISKETKSFQAIDLRNYLLAGLAPIAGGTLKITEIVYTGVLITPQDVANQIPAQFISAYEVVVFSVNSNKYQLKKQNAFIGTGQIALIQSDFITLSLIARNLSASISTYKGLNIATGREEHYSIGSVGFSITKELDGASVETGKILLEQIPQTNLGTGIAIYKGFNATTKLQEFKTLITDNLEFTETASTIKINTPTLSEVPSIIVNSAYAGTESTGSISKPFKTIEAGLLHLVGSGTNLAPQRAGQRVLIQKGLGYAFTGHLEYNASITLEDGVMIESNPTGQTCLFDADKYGDVTIDFRLTLLGDSNINLLKSGFKNRGTTSTGGIGTFKKVSLLGSGSISLNVESNVASPSTRFIIASNDEGTVGYLNRDDVLNFDIYCQLICPNSSLILQGGNSKVRLNNSSVVSGTGSAGNVNVNTKFINVKNNASLELNRVNLNMFVNIASTYISVISTQDSCKLFMADSRILGNVNNFLTMLGNTSDLSMINNLSTSPVTGNFLNSAIVINTLKFNGNNISSGGISPLVDLTKNNTISVTNSINNNFVESLVEYITRAQALLSGLLRGSALKVVTPITAGVFVIGTEYRIKTIGTTNFMLIGATSNTVGLYFSATGIGTGTGVADLVIRQTI